MIENFQIIMEGRKTLSRLEFNHLCLAIQAHLTLDIRKAILTSLGLPIGTVESNAKDNLSFWCYMESRGVFYPEKVTTSLWEGYPEVLKMVQEKMK
jgi:hypothetical protein